MSNRPYAADQSLDAGALLTHLIPSTTTDISLCRVCLINYGEEYGKLVVISDVVDQNRVRVSTTCKASCPLRHSQYMKAVRVELLTKPFVWCTSMLCASFQQWGRSLIPH